MPAGATDCHVHVLGPYARYSAIRDRLTQLTYIPAGGSQGEFVKRLRADIDKWTPVVKATGFRIEE